MVLGRKTAGMLGQRHFEVGAYNGSFPHWGRPALRRSSHMTVPSVTHPPRHAVRRPRSVANKNAFADGNCNST
jgi:hypothetical protein